MAVEHRNPGHTTQHGLLERPLRWLRARKVRSHCRGRRVLDFGCGAGAAVLHALGCVATERVGFDRLFSGTPMQRTDGGVHLSGSFDDLQPGVFDVIMALAVFEHIEEQELPLLLHRLAPLLADGGVVIGTVPTPPSRLLLEFLSFRLGLIDRSQIEEHKVYHTHASLARAFADGGFRLDEYHTFQFGMNSFFLARPFAVVEQTAMGRR